MRRKIAWLLLTTMLVLQIQVPTFAYEVKEKVGANLEVTLQLDYPIVNAKQSNMVLTLLQDGKMIKKMALQEGVTDKGYEVMFEALPLGNYQVRLEGPGYKTYESEVIELRTHEKHMVLGTQNKTFTSGDVNQDGVVDSADIELMTEKIGKPISGSEADLNRDGKVDIEDLSQVYWNQDAKGDMVLYNTRIIMSEMADTALITEGITTENGSHVEISEGSVDQIFDNDEGTELVLKNTTGAITPENPVKIPITFNEEVKVSQIRLTAGTQGVPKEGNVIYEENGKTVKVPFVAEEAPATRGLFGKFRSKKNTITINLGNQVPVQKITVEVTGTENGNHLASISKIEFLEDVVDDSINQEQGMIKGFKGQAKDESVLLSWNSLPNVTGYKVRYGTVSGEYEETLYPSKNTVLVEGLENFTPYYFVVQGTSGEWVGPVSQEITVEPAPEKKPGAPVSVQVETLDSALTVSWRNGDDAVGSNVYYKEKNAKEYMKISNIPGNSNSVNGTSSYTILGLENGKTYSLYVTAYNGAGESTPSETVEATPIADDLVIPKVPTHRELGREHIQKITLRDPQNVDTSFYPGGFNVENMIDKDYRTHWTASTYQRGRGITVTFDQPYEMDYMAFTTRLDRDIKSGRGWYKDYPHWYGIRIWESADSQPKEIVTASKGSSRIPSSGEPGLFILPFPKSTVYQIEVILYEFDGAGNISISEAMFYEYYDLVERIDALFADGTYTALAAGVTLEQINALETELEGLKGARLQVSETVLKEELQLARDLASVGTSELIEELVVVHQGRNPALEADRQFANGRGLSGLQPTGVMAHADEQIVVYVDAPKGGELPTMVFSQYFGEGSWRSNVALKQGRNVITVPRIINYNAPKGGPIYLEYTGAAQEETRVHIRKATPMPTLEILDLDNTSKVKQHKEQVRTYIEELIAYVGKAPITNPTKNPINVTEIGTQKILLSVPATGILESIQNGLVGDLEAQVDRLYETLLAWETNLELHYEILGLTKDAVQSKHRWPDTRINMRYMPMNPGVFMYAAGDHVGIGYGSEKGLVNESRASEDGYFGWGINHEIGHMLNTNEYIYGETTNNIFALFSQTINGGPSRLESSAIYEAMYDKVVSEDTGVSSNVFVSLGMFWQLHLAYDDVNGYEGIGAFYPRLNRLFRDDQTTGIDRHNMLARLASDVVGKDLAPFFDKWDLPLSPETKAYTAKYPAETRAIYYLNDDAKRYRDNGGSSVDYTTMAISAKSEVVKSETSDDQEVLVTIEHPEMPVDKAGISGLLGYEIYRNGKLVAFTTESTYRDALPAGNNMAYDYEVRVFDKLLGHSEKVDAGSVHIATDGTLDKSNFLMENTTSGAITIDMKTAQEIVGIKVKDVTSVGAVSYELTTSSSYKIEVSEDGIAWQTAKEGDLVVGDNLLYFNKPGEGQYDQRIWTYDARYIRIYGTDIIPVTPEQVDVIAYPGDAVYFTEGAIGKLGHDYHYNGGVIKEGSLVVLGTYRGHPVYSKIVLSAKYVNDKDYDASERPGYENAHISQAINGEVFLFAELPEDGQVSKINNGIWLFAPKEQTLPAQIKGNMYRTDTAESVEGGRLVSDTPWLGVPDMESLPTINLN